MLASPSLALAAPEAAPAAPAAKEKKICRIKPAPTGSNRRDGRVCKTEAEWRIYDGGDVDLSSAPNRSVGNSGED
ncbi:MAG: hypothetical protein ACREBO_07990 [Novosphingobium sp.]